MLEGARPRRGECWRGMFTRVRFRFWKSATNPTAHLLWSVCGEMSMMAALWGRKW